MHAVAMCVSIEGVGSMFRKQRLCEPATCIVHMSKGKLLCRPCQMPPVCRFDHLFGMFKTKEGKARRLDLIFVPPEELGFGTLGWIGGKQFLRFMRAYSDDECGMHLNSHRCAAARWITPAGGALRC